MELPEVVEFARNFAVMVRARGPDPKGLKMQKHAFHHYHSGKTTISASGMLFPNAGNQSSGGIPIGDGRDGLTLVVTVASVVEPFLLPQYRENNIEKGSPKLIAGAEIDVMIENKMLLGSNLNNPKEGTSQWIPSKLLALVDVPAASHALQSLVEASGGLSERGSWEIGWSLALLNNAPQSLKNGSLQTQVGHDIRSPFQNQSHSGRASGIGMPTIKIAFLGIRLVTKTGLPDVTISLSSKRGDLLLAMGSPFGLLSPAHFLNSISVGSVANLFPSSSHKSSLLMADIRCLPGMEGGPVFNEHAHLIGILSRPLRQRAGGAEIQLVIPWEAIALSQSGYFQCEAPKEGNMNDKGQIHPVGNTCSSSSISSERILPVLRNHNSHQLPALQIEKAMASITLITIDDGTWASGVVLNNQGLILTNAHLLEPWRFGKANVLSGVAAPPDTIQERQNILPSTMTNADTSLGNEPSKSRRHLFYQGYNKRIRVRLDNTNPWIWHDARVVFTSKGPLDVALLQLNSIPEHSSPIIPDFSCPSTGSKAYIIGHGLFGPRSDLCPSVCSGVVARVVKAQNHLHPIEPGSHLRPVEPEFKEGHTKYLPAMLETTAAVHAGGSGGAVVNSDGHMIGLVTSNARHGGGTVIPQLNFSIPCAALELIFKFSEDMKDLSILHALDKPNEHLSSVWALVPLPSPRQVPHFLPQPESLPGNSDQEKKGSRFAKFIAERSGELVGPNNKTSLSKL